MAQIIDKPGLGDIIGQQFGTGLSNALQQFSQMKFNNLMQRHQALRNETGLKAIPGFTPETAKAYSNLDPVTLATVVKETMAGPHRQAFAQAISGMGGNGSNVPVGQAQPTSGQSKLGAISPATQQGGVSGQNNETGLNIPPQLTEHETEKLIDWNFKKNKESREANQFDQKMEAQRYTATAPIRSVIVKAKANADIDIARLNKLEKLSVANKLPNDMVYKFLDTIGMSDVGSLVGKDAQEFNKIITDFTSTAKDRYGARISNFELGTFLRGLPSLLQTQSGKKQVIKDLKALAELPKKKFELMQQIRKENKGIPPMDLEEQIEEKMEPFKKQIFEKYGEYGEEIPQYNIVSKSKTKPNAAEKKGKVLRFPDGKFYASDGMRWRPVEVNGNKVNYLPEEESM